jgi:hypothetical protein
MLIQICEVVIKEGNKKVCLLLSLNIPQFVLSLHIFLYTESILVHFAHQIKRIKMI